MHRATWTQVSEQLDRLFFLPFFPNETPQIRTLAIEAYLTVSGWTWDQVLDEIIKPEGN